VIGAPEAIAAALRRIRARARARRPALLGEAVATMTALGFDVVRCRTADEAMTALLAIVPPGAAVVAHPSVLGRALDLDRALPARGRRAITLPGDGAPALESGGPAREPEAWRALLLEADAGITGATALVADTGSLVLAEDLGFGRAASNVPPVHIALVRVDRVVETVLDGLALARGYASLHLGCPAPRYISFISGPSKTADIGFTLVRGMHGPGAVHVLLCEEPRGGAEEDDLRTWVLP
jgi:L-lactate utilization protein LutB